MCDYSVAATPRKDKAHENEELLLVNLSSHYSRHYSRHVVRGFASPINLTMPVCMMPGTKLRYMGLRCEESTLALPDEGVAEFTQTEISDPNTTHDALKFSSGKIVKLVYIEAGLQVRVIGLPMSKETQVSEPQFEMVEILQHFRHAGVRAQ